MAAGNLFQVFQTRKVENIKGLIHRVPLTGAFLLLGFIVLTGFPPFGIFYSELLILKQAMITQHYLVVFFYLFFLSIIFFGFSKIILQMVLGKPSDTVKKTNKKEDFFMIMPLVILTVILIATGVIVPGSVYRFIDEASMLLGSR